MCVTVRDRKQAEGEAGWGRGRKKTSGEEAMEERGRGGSIGRAGGRKQTQGIQCQTQEHDKVMGGHQHSKGGKSLRTMEMEAFQTSKRKPEDGWGKQEEEEGISGHFCCQTLY